MSIYTRLTPSFIVNTPQLWTIGRLYPYEVFSHRDVGGSACGFLQQACAGYPDDTYVLAISQHNGHGYQWGVILLRYPFWDEDWHLIAQFGHNDGLRNLSSRHGLHSVHPPMIKKYFKLVEKGSVSESEPDQKHPASSADWPRRLSQIYSGLRAA